MSARRYKGVPAKFDRSKSHRRSLMAKVHLGQKTLGMEDDDYRAMLFGVTGKTSCADCSAAELVMVVDKLKSFGFVPKARAGSKPASHLMARKALALWVSLYHLNVVRNREDEALEAFAKRQLGCEKLDWARQSESHKLIEALKNMAERNGWQQYDENGGRLTVLGLQASLVRAFMFKLVEAKLIPEEWDAQRACWSLCGFESEEYWPLMKAPELSRVAAMLGGELRKATGPK